MAPAMALFSSLASAAVVIDCDYRGADRHSRFTVVEDAEGFVLSAYESDGVPLVEALKLGARGDVTGVVMRFPKGSADCGRRGNPVRELWCQGAALPVVLSRANGETVEATLATSALDVALDGRWTLRRMAYRLSGSRPLPDDTTLRASQNGSYPGSLCRR
jgi:hypothetical protein